MLTALLLAPMAAFGQGATTASVRGQVTDSNDEPLPGANVVAVHVPSGTQYGASTNAQGRYTLSNLRVGGPYQITVSFVGYQSKREEGVTLNLGQSQQMDFTLREKTAELQEIQVIGKTEGILSSQREGVSTNISTEEIESQPTMGRKIADIARLVPQSYVVNSDDDGAAISIGQQSTDFNSIYIDGAVSNDVFGLSAQGTDGGQSGATPISLSAVEQVSVDVSPFQVTKSGFTGGAINFVTKSGTNDFEGSFEYFRRGSALTQDELTFRGSPVVDGLPSASDNRFVGTLGGPIIEDKLFFFVNVDIRNSEDALPAQTPFLGRELGIAGQNPNQDDANELDQLSEVRDFVERNTGYDPGVPGDKATVLDSRKFLARLDYNVTQNHKLTARYYYNDNDNRDRFQTTQEFVNFSNNSEVFPNTQHNAMLQWNGSFGNRVASKTTATYKNVVDDRGVQGEPFPSITVDDGAQGSFRLGSEAFSRPNYLEQTVATLSNQTDIFVGNHTLTVGTHNEFYSIDNRFAVFGPGSYEFGSVDAFAETVCHYASVNQGSFGIQGPGQICQAQYPNPEPQTGLYLRQYSLLDDDPSTPEFESLANDNTNLRSEFNAVKLGFYAQDQWQMSDRFRLTFGLRADIPKILDDPGKAEDANSATLYGTDLASSDFDGPSVSSFYDLRGARAGQMPDWRAFWSPRAGFNYAVDEERTTQIRGGTGVYTSRLPFVWPGGAFLNDGVSSDFAVGLSFAGPLPLRRPQNALTKFEPNTGIFGPGAFGGPGASSVDDLTPTGNLFVFQDDFSYPRVWRTSLAIDRQLPFNLVGTLEGQYTNQLQDIITRNVNLKQPNANLDGPDNRPIYQAGQYTDGTKFIDDRYGQIFLLENTTRGYSYELTARLQKQATQVWSGATMRGKIAYTYGDARSLNTYGGDTVGSLWDGNEHVSGTNNLTLGRSEFALGHQVQVSVAYRQELSENVSTNLSLFYTGSSGRPFSYTIGSAVGAPSAEVMIGDEGGQPLFYVPQSVSQLNLQPITDSNGNVLRSVAEQRTDLARFIENVENLNNNRDGYAVRNGDRTPFEGVVDLNFSVDFTGELIGRTQRLTLNANIFNFSSLLGDVFGTDWGYRYVTPSGGTFNVVEFAGFQDSDGDGNPSPVYQSGLGTAEGRIVREKEDIFDLRTSGTTYSSLYQIQLGLKYTF